MVLAPEGATVSLLQCQQEASTQKNSNFTTRKAFQWKSREGTRRVSSALSVEQRNHGYFRNKKWQRSCALCYCDQNKPACFIKNTNSWAVPEASERGWMHACSKSQRAVWKPPCWKAVQNKPSTYCRRIIEKKSRPLERAANKDIRASSIRFLPNTCEVVLPLVKQQNKASFCNCLTCTEPGACSAEQLLIILVKQSRWETRRLGGSERKVCAPWQGQSVQPRPKTETHYFPGKQVLEEQVYTTVRDKISSWEIYPSLLKGPPSSLGGCRCLH